MPRKKLTEFPQAYGALGFYRVLSDTEFSGNFLLRKTVNLPQSNDLTTSRWQGLDSEG